jgi:hypothetical protein
MVGLKTGLKAILESFPALVRGGLPGDGGGDQGPQFFIRLRSLRPDDC